MPVAFGDVKRSPMLNTFIRDFKFNSDRVIQELVQQTGVWPSDPAITGHLLFKVHELDRTKLGISVPPCPSRLLPLILPLREMPVSES